MDYNFKIPFSLFINLYLDLHNPQRSNTQIIKIEIHINTQLITDSTCFFIFMLNPIHLIKFDFISLNVFISNLTQITRLYKCFFLQGFRRRY